MRKNIRIKKLQLAVIAAILIYIALVAGRVVYFSYFSGLPKIVQEDKVFGEGEELRLIMAGDSITQGIGASSVDNTYAYKLAEELGKDYRVVYRNVAEKGSETEDLVSEQLQEIIAFDPDIVVVTIGGNDLTHVRLESRIISNYRRVIEEISNNTEAILYIANIPNFTGVKALPVWYVNLISKRAVTINSDISELESGRVKIVDVHEKWFEVPRIEDAVARDGFHANDYGYTFWLDAFLERIREKF